MATVQWQIDSAHSEIQFKVKHLMITTVTGRFREFSATAVTNSADSFEGANIEFSAVVASVDTGNAQRDGHLLSDDFFNASAFPTLRFVSDSYRATGADGAILEGDLTIRDVTRRVALTVEFNGIAADPWGNVKAGFELHGTISRKEFGLMWNAVTEAGGVVVSDEVRLLLHVQMVKQAV